MAAAIAQHAPAWQNPAHRLYLAPRMNIPPPDLPAPTHLPPPGGLPPPHLPPPAAHADQHILSQFERPPVEVSTAAKVARQIEEAIPERAVMASAALIGDAKSYLTRRGGGHLLRTGALIALAYALAAHMPFIGFAPLLIAAIYTGSFLYKVIHSTLEGEDSPPDWPKLSDAVEELVKPGVRITAAFLVAHAAWFYVKLSADPYAGVNAVAQWTAYFVAAAYFPFAILMIVFHERFASCAPWIAIPASLRCMPASLTALGFSIVSFTALHALDCIPLLGALLVPAAGLPLLVMLARMVGMIAAQHRGSLADLH